MKVFILTTIRAPYRTELFDLLNDELELTVFFEQKTDKTRNDEWFTSKSKKYKEIYSKYWHKNSLFIRWDILSQLKENYDMVVFYEYSTVTSMIAMEYCKKKGIPYCINSDGAFIKRDSFLKFKLKSHFIKNATGLLANGNSSIHYFFYYGAKLEQINNHNFTSLKDTDILKELKNEEEIREIKNQLNLSNNKKIFLTVGRFIELKRIDFLIELWKRLPNDYELLIIGDGILKSQYEVLISKNNLTNVKLVDFLNKPDLYNYYYIATGFLFPSNNEVWGLVVQEALACGLPVVGTVKSNAVSELIVDGENGYICRLNYNDWEKAIYNLAEDDSNKKKMKHKSIETIKNNSLELEALQIINFVNQL